MDLGGRKVVGTIGNEAVSKPPLRPPGGAGIVGPRSNTLPIPPQGFGQSGGGVYLPVQKISAVLLQNTSAELLIEPEGIRVYFSVRNASSSLGVLGVSFNSIPSGVELCDLELAPGQGFAWEYFVPQNRIFGFAFNGDCHVILNYSNKQTS